MAILGYNQGNRKTKNSKVDDWILADFEEKKSPEFSHGELWAQCEHDFAQEWENDHFRISWKYPIRNPYPDRRLNLTNQSAEMEIENENLSMEWDQNEKEFQNDFEKYSELFPTQNFGNGKFRRSCQNMVNPLTKDPVTKKRTSLVPNRLRPAVQSG